MKLNMIKQGRPVALYCQELHELKLINSEFLFNLYIRLSNLESDIQAGFTKYQLELQL